MRVYEDKILGVKIREDGKFWCPNKQGWTEGVKYGGSPYWRLTYSVVIDGKMQRPFVHHLMGVFVPKFSHDFAHMDHIDSDLKKCNHVSNLRWLTHRLNMINQKARPSKVDWITKGGVRIFKWRALVCGTHLGLYSSKKKAQQVMDDYRELLFYSVYKQHATDEKLRQAQERGDCYLHSDKYNFELALDRIGAGVSRAGKVWAKIRDVYGVCFGSDSPPPVAVPSRQASFIMAS